MAQIKIGDLEQLDRFGRTLAHCLYGFRPFPIFLQGELGAGKTALVKSMVKNLEGGELAEVSSPSFNIYNIYPCHPPVFHCDLYRCGPNLPEEVLEALDRKEDLIILEWAEFFPKENLPENFLDISFNLFKNERLLTLTAHGDEGKGLLQCLFSLWKH